MAKLYYDHYSIRADMPAYNVQQPNCFALSGLVGDRLCVEILVGSDGLRAIMPVGPFAPIMGEPWKDGMRRERWQKT